MPLFQGYPEVVSRLFGGPQDPRLSPEANQAATRQGMIQSGLATIAASGPGGTTPAQAIAAGLMQGQEAAQGSRAQTFRTQSQQQMADIAGQNLPLQESMTQMFKQAVVSGDVDTMRAFSNVLPTVLGGQRGPAPKYIETLEPNPENPDQFRRVWVNQANPADRIVGGVAPPPSSGVDVNVDTGTIPPGFRAVRDDEGRVTEMEIIPGGPADIEAQEAARTREAERDVTTRAARTVVEDVGRALNVLEDSGNTAAGLAGLVEVVPGTPAHTLNQHIESIKGNIGIDSLLRIKASGSGLGQVPQAQLEMLASLLGRLDTTMQPEDLQFNLERIGRLYEDIIEKAGGEIPNTNQQEAPTSQPRGRLNFQEIFSEELGGGGGS